MIRRFLLVAMALAFVGFVGAPAQAGSPTRTKKVPIRFKNIGVQPVIVNAQSPNTGGGAALAQNGVFNGSVNSGAYTAFATGATNAITKSLRGTSTTPIYLFVEADNTATTITVAPPF